MNELEMVLSGWNAQAEVAKLNIKNKLSPDWPQHGRTRTRRAIEAFDFEKGLFFAWRQQRSAANC